MTGFVIIRRKIIKSRLCPWILFSEWISKYYLLLKYTWNLKLSITKYWKVGFKIQLVTSQIIKSILLYVKYLFKPRKVANKPFILRYSNVFISNMPKGPNLARKIYSGTNESLDNEFDLLQILWMSCGGIDWLIVYISYGFSVYHT